MNNKKKQVETSTVLITIAFLAIFIIMPPLSRILYQEEEQPNNPDSGEVATENISMTCIKSLSTGDSITSTSEFNNGQIISNRISLSSQTVITSTSVENQNDIQKYNSLLNLFQNIEGQNIEADITDPSSKITLIINKTLVNSTTEEIITSQFQDQSTLMAYYQEKGYQCS